MTNEREIGHFCPGGKSVCPDTSTCCLVAAKEYGCCPMQDAVCCEDHTHCCPNGTKCDVGRRQCLRDNGDWIKMQSKLKVAKLNKCWQCSLNSTCCKIGFKNIAYCPLAQAVSCAGHKHCCPQHTICDQALKSCITESGAVLPWIKQEVAHLSKAARRIMDFKKEKFTSKVFTPKNDSYNNIHSCCKSRCCPLRSAVCCPTKNYCCPQGYSCKEEEERCVTEEETNFSFEFWTRTFISSNKRTCALTCDNF